MLVRKNGKTSLTIMSENNQLTIKVSISHSNLMGILLRRHHRRWHHTGLRGHDSRLRKHHSRSWRHHTWLRSHHTWLREHRWPRRHCLWLHHGRPWLHHSHHHSWRCRCYSQLQRSSKPSMHTIIHLEFYNVSSGELNRNLFFLHITLEPHQYQFGWRWTTNMYRNNIHTTYYNKATFLFHRNIFSRKICYLVSLIPEITRKWR